MKNSKEVSMGRWVKWIMDAIKKIRHQKQRPSEERIFRAICQHHTVTKDVVQEQLKKAVEKGTVFIVYSKGYMSYKTRDETVLKRRQITAETDISQVLIRAIRELAQTNRSTLTDIERYIRQSHVLNIPKSLELRLSLKSALKMAIAKGLLIKHGVSYKLKKHDSDQPKVKIKSSKADINDNTESTSQELSPVVLCLQCLGIVQITDQLESTVSCFKCKTSKLHRNCAGITLTSLMDSGCYWVCSKCASCAKCGENVEEQLYLIKCYRCEKTFHIPCMKPDVRMNSKEPWSCKQCIESLNGVKVKQNKKMKKSEIKEEQECLPPASDEGLTKQKNGDLQDIGKLPAEITPLDVQIFKQAQKICASSDQSTADDSDVQYPQSITFGAYEISTWYPSSYPKEFSTVKTIFLCEFCLIYSKSKHAMSRHQQKCIWRHPPGNEIYQSNDLSVFEVDGELNKIYCQNLCLMAKFFVENKTLYCDTEPFLFYVLTLNDKKGFHFAGYFSKQKNSPQNFNVSCIMTMPQHQRKGYGRFLIEFSYLLSRKEPGSPEKPLSSLGLVSYQAYWKSAILEYLQKRKKAQVTIDEISKYTGMNSHDIADTFQNLSLVQRAGNKLLICFSKEDQKSPAQTNKRIFIDENCLLKEYR